MACLRTDQGVVAMRWGKSREKQSITVRDSKAQPKVISGGWLRSSDRAGWLSGDRHHKPGWQSPEDFALYQKALKQACLLAARQMELRDLDDLQKAQVVARERGYPESVEGVRRLKDEARKKVLDMEHGKEPVPLPPQNLRAEAERLRRREEPRKNKVYKKGQKTGMDRQAWFLIESGKLKIYPSDRRGCKPKTVYELSGVHSILQDERTFRRTDASAPKGYTERLQVTIPERKHGPLFLYSTGNQAKSWERSIQMAKCSAADRNSLGNILTKVGNILLVRGWTSLFRYYRELDNLRRMVYRFQGKVTMMEISKGMTKFKLAHKKRRQDEDLKEQQQQWAAQLLADKLQRVKAVTTLRDPRSVRQDMISSVQSRFRVYRQAKMADREYPLGTSVQSRVQQALTGKVVGAAFKSLKSVEALTLILNKETERQIRGVESQMKGKLKTYSEVNLSAGQVSINVSENFGMLSFVDTDSDMEHSHLNNAGWAHYVNIDEISSVILHSERRMAQRDKKYELAASMSKGSWVTINGPRICWCRHVRMDAEGRKEVVGAANPFGVPMALAQGAKVRWFRVSVVVKSASVVADEGDTRAGEPEAGEELETYMVLHFLGRRFQSEVQAGESPRYFVLPVPQAASGGAQTLEVEVPISDEGGLAALDDSEVGMDIVAWNHDPALRQTIWAGKLPLWKALAAPEALAQSGQQQQANRLPEEVVVSLAEIMRNGPRRTERLVRLVGPDEVDTGRQLAGAQVFLEFTARIHDVQEPQAQCISPELQGCGPISALFTSHRGAWFDPKLSERKRFFIDHVANFVELVISDLYFPISPETTDDKDGNPVQYVVEARCSGVTVSTVPMHRPKAGWKRLMAVDPFKISFQDTRLFLPLQPGAWFSELPHQRPVVELRVLCREQTEPITMNFKEFLGGGRAVPRQTPDFLPVFHGRFSLDELVVDHTKENRRVGLNPVDELEATYNLTTGESSVTDKACEVLLSATLRDRDYALLRGTSRQEPGLSRGVICVGDKVTLPIEEPQVYPKSALEFRHRMMPGEYNPELSGRAGSRAPLTPTPLREPALQHEFHDSRLGSVPGLPPFRQGFIPKASEDVVPCRFVLPKSEADFLREGRAGQFWRVMEELSAKHAADRSLPHRSDTGTASLGSARFHHASAGAGTPRGQEPTIISQLSHLVRHVACTVLAVYSDGRCDVEMAPQFVAEWERFQERQLALPGQVVVREFPIDPHSPAALYMAPEGEGDISTLTRRRVILRGVSLLMLTTIQSTGFSVYDAAFGQVEDAFDAHPDEFCNDFAPGLIAKFGDLMTFQGSRRGGYRLPAGPVPVDAGNSCKYEWSLHLQLADEEDMYQFVTNLRQTVRLGLHEKQKGLDVYMRRVREMAKLPAISVGKALASGGGHLEVVVVECRHLRPPRVQRDKDWRQTVDRMRQADLNAMVRMRVRHGMEGCVSVKFNIQNLDYHRIQQNPAQVAGLSGAMQAVVAYQLTGGIRPSDMEVELVLVEGQTHAQVSVFLPAGTDANKVSQELVTEAEVLNTELTKRIKMVPRIKDSSVGTLEVVQFGAPQVTGDLTVKGSKVQTTVPITGSSPNWAAIPNLEGSGGWVFKLPDMDPMPEGRNRHLVFELEVVDQQTMGEKVLGRVRVPVFDPQRNVDSNPRGLCEEDSPFSNQWLSLSRLDQEMYCGDVHIMTMWVTDQPSLRNRHKPKTARGYLTHLHRQMLLSTEAMHEIRDPVYHVQVGISGYNPNNYRDAFPERLCDATSRHIELMSDILPYVECREQLSFSMWSEIDRMRLRDSPPALKPPRREATDEKLLDDEHEEEEDQPPESPVKARLGQLRREWARSTAHQDRLWKLDGFLRHGVPSTKRAEVWMQILCADDTRDGVTNLRGPGGLSSDQPPEVVERNLFDKMVDMFRPLRSESMVQLAEDMVGAASWETSTQPSVQELHMERLRRAHDVCIALICFSQDSEIEDDIPKDVVNYRDDVPRSAPSRASGLAYCEALLVLAYHLLAAQVPEEKTDEQRKAHQREKKAVLLKHRTQKLAVDLEAERDAEVNAFWMLYALAGSASNGAFRDYYATPRPASLGARGASDDHPIASESGAMCDVYRVGMLLARYDREVYVHLEALGFHLSTVFYGAFMRLFAFSLPISTLFNFWDLLFSESCHPSLPKHKPPRHSLIDLAFGVLRNVRQDLLACESAGEARDCIVGYLESLYAPAAAVEIAAEAERFLWEGEGAVQDALSVLQATAQQAVTPLHVKQYDAEQEFWRLHFQQFRLQNAVLRPLVQDPRHNLLTEPSQIRGPIASGPGLPGNNVPGTNNNAARSGAGSDLRITTKNVKDRIIPDLAKLLMGEHTSEGKYGGMLRPTPAKLRDLGPEVRQDLAGAMTSWIAWAQDSMRAQPQDLGKPVAVAVPPPEGTPGEPTTLDLAEWTRQVQRSLGPCWMDLVPKIWDTFHSSTEKRLSMNEFFLALICVSKGTVAEKATTLFNLYGTAHPTMRKHHATPVTPGAALVIDRFDSGKVERGGVFFDRPPRQEDISRSVLHFKVFSRASQHEHEALLGEVYVTTLRPFVAHSPGGEEAHDFTIWGETNEFSRRTVGDGGGGARPVVGWMRMSLEWVVSSNENPEVGQLVIGLREIEFNTVAIDAPNKRNPRVALLMYDEAGQEQHIKSAPGGHGPGHGGDNMGWPETMDWRRDALHHHGRGNQGWDARNNVWKWSPAVGNQASEQGLIVRKDFVTSRGPTRTTISMKACRIITQGILQRTLQCVTNRQAALLADQIFSPARAVPGILDAVLVVGEKSRTQDTYSSIRTLREQLDQNIKPAYIDLKHQLVKAQEHSISESQGSINLFPAAGGEKEFNLKDLKIRDPFAGELKTLWIRYCRAGDGQRFNSLIEVSQTGAFRTKPVPLDMELGTQAGKAQMLLSKDEFVTCLTSSPLLSEPLRQLSSSDNRVENVPKKDPIALQVNVSDPSRDGDEDELFTHLSVRQGILLELWSHNDFLGECWLPAFSDLGKDARRFILDVHSAPPDAGGTATRPDRRKRKDQCTGMLFVTATWTFPLADPDANDSDADADTGQLKMMSVGMLKLHIEKAEGLRRVGLHGDQVPKGVEVHVHRRNECLLGVEKSKIPKNIGAGGWLISSHGVAGDTHSTIMRTKGKDGRQPEWNETAEVRVPTGSFEVRSYKDKRPQRGHGAHAAHPEEDQAFKIFFGDDVGEDDRHKARGNIDPKEGRRHGVKVYLGETIHQFKHKLQEACRREAKECEKHGTYRDVQRAENFRTVANDISYEHIVLDFLPSAALSRLYKTKEKTTEFRKMYKEEEADPSSWQPLDPARTFGHYPHFGLQGKPKKLRVVEGTDMHKLRNNRLRQFEVQRQKWRETTSMLNAEQRCFGYARYVHIQDAGSFEWRPAILDRPTGAEESRRCYKAAFIHSPLSTWSGQLGRRGPGGDAEPPGGAELMPKEELDEDNILLAPLHPMILGSDHLEHADFLLQARQLHEDGMAVQDIADHLNAELRNRWQRRRASVGGQDGPLGSKAAEKPEEPPAITLADVEHTLKASRAHDAHMDAFHRQPSGVSQGATLTRSQSGGAERRESASSGGSR
jgi:hypothetical protein